MLRFVVSHTGEEIVEIRNRRWAGIDFYMHNNAYQEHQTEESDCLNHRNNRLVVL